MAKGFARLILAASLLVLAVPASAQSDDGPTPRAVIYPGDIIRSDMLVDDPTGGVRDGPGPYVQDWALIVGKAARLTLLPGHAIPFAGLMNRRLVRDGGQVRLVYAQDGLTIVTVGAALQDGAVGDLVKVRNSDSGVTISGVVEPDGSVRVSGG